MAEVFLSQWPPALLPATDNRRSQPPGPQPGRLSPGLPQQFTEFPNSEDAGRTGVQKRCLVNCHRYSATVVPAWRNQLRRPGCGGPCRSEDWLRYVAVVGRIGQRQIAQRACRQVQIDDQHRRHLGAHVHDLGQRDEPGSGLVDLR